MAEGFAVPSLQVCVCVFCLWGGPAASPVPWKNPPRDPPFKARNSWAAWAGGSWNSPPHLLTYGMQFNLHVAKPLLEQTVRSDCDLPVVAAAPSCTPCPSWQAVGGWWGGCLSPFAQAKLLPLAENYRVQHVIWEASCVLLVGWGSFLQWNKSLSKTCFHFPGSSLGPVCSAK